MGSGRVGPVMSTDVAPSDRGNVSPLPRPYAWNSFVVENVTSSSRSPSTWRAKVSQVTWMSWCRCTTPLGLPVDPELYSQKPGSSRWVGTGSISSRWAASASSSSTTPAPAPPRATNRSSSWPASASCSRGSETASVTTTSA